MATSELNVLLICDDKPGHYRQAEGVLAAIARLRPINVNRIEVRRRFLLPTRVLQFLVNRRVPPPLVLRLGYGLDWRALAGADLVVSAGGETLAANAAAARVLGAANVFCGRLRRLRPEHVRVVLVSLESLAAHPNYVVCLPPSAVEPANPRTGAPSPAWGPRNPPRLVGALVGGNTGSLRYTEQDWSGLIGLMRNLHRQCGTRWHATTSRRSEAFVADQLGAMAREADGPLARFIDYRSAGPGALGEIFAAVDAVLCTEDSTTMISEAVAAGLPVVTLGPAAGQLEAREVEYRNLLARKGWCRALRPAEQSPEGLLAALESLTPRTTSHLDDLAAALKSRLPQLFCGN